MKNMQKCRLLAFIFLFLALGILSVPVYAQNPEEVAVAEQETKLRSELQKLEAEIAQQQEILRAKQRESVSLERDIAILNAQIKQAQLKIQAQNIAIQQLGKDISIKNATIEELDQKIERGKESLSVLIRKTNELDEFSLVEVVLANKDLSEFFSDLDSFQSIKRDLEALFESIRENKSLNESEREILQDRKNKETDIKVAIEAEKRNIEKAESQKKELLAISKGEEKTYQDVLKEREKRAAEIRSALFALRDTAAIPFGTALTYANAAYAKTGVRPAFLLAILTQESNLGENVGTCNRPGDPPEKSWRNIMPGPNDNSWRDDQTIYLQITSQLGLDPDSMPLSCPWRGGWGGAMGPSQFIPTTWDLYKSRIASAVGKSIPNPWDPQDAFMASAIYLADLGANKGGYTAERTAALKYYAGNNWQKASNAFYGNEVMVKAQNIQENMIDPLQGL
jgi:membrane-bound lytic murein transglycosylase B